MAALLALFLRSVRDDMRSRALLWSRIGIALAMLFVVFTSRAVFYMGGAPGLAFFSTLVWMNFIFICLAGMSYFASAVTEEKEELTLGLLRMTDLSPLAILFGKSTSRMVGGSLLLLVQLPFAMLAITLGGVRLDQVIQSYVLLACFLFFICNVALLASVISRRTGTAGVLTTVFATLYLCWPFLISWMQYAFKGYPSGINELRKLLQPFGSIFYTPGVLADVLGTRSGPAEIGPNVAVLLTGGSVAFVFARVLFERFCNDESTRSAPKVSGGAVERRGFLSKRPGRAWFDAVCWRDFHFIHGGGRMLIVKGILDVGVVIWIGWNVVDIPSYPPSSRWPILCAMTLTVCVAFACIESLFASSRIYRLERKNKTLSSLYLLPDDLDGLLKSKRRAVFMSLAPTLFFGAMAFFFGMPFFLRKVGSQEAFWGLLTFTHILLQVIITHCLIAWFSLRMNWGALPLSLGIAVVGNLIAGVLAAILFELGALFILIIADGFILAAMRRVFRERLAAVAGEE